MSDPAALPLPLMVSPGDDHDVVDGEPTEICVLPARGCDQARARAFGAALAKCRVERGLEAQRIEIFAPTDVVSRPPEAPRGRVWVPHIFCWRTVSEVSLAWELSALGRLRDLVDADAAKVSRWSRHPVLMIRLGHMAVKAAGDSAGPQEGHLSFRWLLANEEVAASAFAKERVSIGHVSLHVEPAEEEWIVEILTAIGLVEIPRPASISVPGRWLQCGNARVHLNSRHMRAGEPAFPGTAPNHVCFAVTDLAATERVLQALGVTSKRAGSLEQPQLWFRLPGGSFVELQPEP